MRRWWSHAVWWNSLTAGDGAVACCAVVGAACPSIPKHPLADEDIDERVAFAVLVGGERDLDVGLGGQGVDDDAGC